MNLPERRDIRALIASPCLLKADRAGRALFISDFGRRSPEPQAAENRLEAAGYICIQTRGMTLIDLSPAAYAAFYRALPDLPLPALTDENAPFWGLCRILERHPQPLEAQDIKVLAQALRWARLNERAKLLDLVRSSLADALREGQAPPYHTARLLSAIINRQTTSIQGGTPC